MSRRDCIICNLFIYLFVLNEKIKKEKIRQANIPERQTAATVHPTSGLLLLLLLLLMVVLLVVLLLRKLLLLLLLLLLLYYF